MVAPTIREATNTVTDPSNVKYDTPTIKKLVQVVKGNEPTGERIQITSIEGRDKNTPPFLYLVRQLSTTSFEAIRGPTHPSGSPGTLEASGTEFRNVMNSAISALPDSSDVTSQGVIYIQGANLNCLTGTVNVNRAVTVDGLGSAVVQKTGEYTDIRTAMFQIARSNITIRGITFEDVYQNPSAYDAASDARAQVLGITCGPPANVKNITVENCFFKNIYYHPIHFSGANTSRIIDHVTVSNNIVDTSGSNTTVGAGIVIGLGVKDCLVDNNKVYETGHSAIDVWGVLEHIKVTNNYIYKSAKPNGCGIAVVRFADHLTSEGLAEDIVISNNRVYGPLVNDAIKVSAQARKVIVANNLVDGTLNQGISVVSDNIDGTDLYARETTIEGNIVRNTGSQGIRINADSTITTPHGILVIGNQIYNVKRHGIDFNSNIRFGVISSNIVNGYGTDTVAGTYSGVHLRICKNCNVTGNTLYGTATNASWSVYAENNSDYNIICNNNCNKTMSTVGANSVIQNNITVAG